MTGQYSPEERAAIALERIADSVDDFMELTLATTGMAKAAQLSEGYDPRKALELLGGLTDAILARRASRGR